MGQCFRTRWNFTYRSKNYFVTSTFSEPKLTGMQGDVMKESMTVAKTLAFSLLNQDQLLELNSNCDKTKTRNTYSCS